MERALGHHQRPQFSSVVEWLSGTESNLTIISISNKRPVLDELCRRKLNGELSELFSTVFFVYLHKSKERLEQHLFMPRAEGIWRSSGARPQIRSMH